MSPAASEPFLLLRRLDDSDWTRAPFEGLQVSGPGRAIMGLKGSVVGVEIRDVSMPLAQILKQEALSVGADFATPKDAILLKTPTTNGLLLGTRLQLGKLMEKMAGQPLGGKELGARIQTILSIKKVTPQLLGVLNLTPDSFYDGGRHTEKAACLAKLESLNADGADRVDLGPFSSRPGSKPVEADEQTRRLDLCLKEAVDLFGTKAVSIDTCDAAVAEWALERGAGWINDISALADAQMLSVVKGHGAGLMLMHMQGQPSTMQDKPVYENVTLEVARFLKLKAEEAVSAGLSPEKIFIDPGIGFGKTPDHNLTLLRELSAFSGLGFPLLVGLSRKSFMKSLSAGDTADDRLAGSLAGALHAAENGAALLRVHDVKETKQALNLWQSLKSG